MTDEELIARLRDDRAALGDRWEAANRIEALKTDTVKLLDEANRDYNRKTNDLIARHAEQVAALVKERDALIHDLDRIKDSETHFLNRAERLEEALRLLHDNVVQAFPSLANLGPVANARAALTQKEPTDG